MAEHDLQRRRTPDEAAASRLRKAPDRDAEQSREPADSAGAEFVGAPMETQVARLIDARSDEERAELVGRLQRAYGNQYVQRALEAIMHTEAVATNTEPDQQDLPGGEYGTRATRGVQTVLRPGYSPSTNLTGILPPPSLEESRPANDVVVPGGTPNVVEPGAGNTCQPRTRAATLDWGVVEDGEEWRANVNSMTLTGTINIQPWPSAPNDDTVVPNTPNPVDGGNINDTEGSLNNWEYVIQDLEDYDTPGGGAGAHWHSTEASRAHEWEHWNEDYVQDAVMGSNGGDWLVTNADIDDLRVSKEESGETAAEGRTALEPLVNARLRQFQDSTIAYWNGPALKDEPGLGGKGYAAGMRVLDRLITRTRSYGTTLRARRVVSNVISSIGRFISSLF